MHEDHQEFAKININFEIALKNHCCNISRLLCQFIIVVSICHYTCSITNAGCSYIKFCESTPFCHIGPGECGRCSCRASEGLAKPARDTQGERNSRARHAADGNQSGAARQRHQGRGPVRRGAGQHGVSSSDHYS